MEPEHGSQYEENPTKINGIIYEYIMFSFQKVHKRETTTATLIDLLSIYSIPVTIKIYNWYW